MSAFFIYMCYNDFQLKQRGDFVSKIKIKTTLCITGDANDKISLETEGIKNANKLIFKDNDTLVTLIFEKNDLFLQRRCEDYIIDMRFNLDNSSCCYALNKIGKLNLELITKELIMNDGEIKLNYHMNENSYTYLVKYEVLQ